MAQVIYNPLLGYDAPDSTQQYGYAFAAGRPVEVTNPKHLAKFSGHPFFTVGEAEPTDAPNDPNQLRAVHNGGGRFIIVRGDKDQRVKEGLTKADADAFNAMSDADKETYVAD